MNRKALFLFCFLLLNFIPLMDVRAQTTYSCDLKEDDTFTWEVTELTLHNFKKVFGFEPVFEVGDQIQKQVLKILPVPNGWSLTIYEWDYKDVLTKNGTIAYSMVYNDPTLFAEDFFIPTPTSEFLAQAAKTLPSEYIVSGNSLTKRAGTYIMTKEYDPRGILLSETYVDDDGIVLVKVEGTFKIIPFTVDFYFTGFTALSIIAIIFIMMKKKKLSFD